MPDRPIAVVTGASGGIGSAIALELGRRGYDVVVHAGHDGKRAAAVTAELQQLGCNAHWLVANIGTASEHAALVASAWQWRERVDVWVNNAGADVLTGEAAQWSFEAKLQRLWEVDVRGTIGLSRLIGARMLAAGRGSIVNIGWDQADGGMAGDSGEMFAAVKGAIMAFTRSLAKSLAPTVRANCVAPGWIKTAWGAQASEYWSRRAVGESLLHRWGTPDDVARAVAFVASNDGAFINGHVLPVNGGLQGWSERPAPSESEG